MTRPDQTLVVPSLASILCALVLPGALSGQLVSTRPASVSLTVTIPPRAPSDFAVTWEGRPSLVQRTPTALDFETVVGLANRAPARIEIRLGATWSADSTHVWVRNQRGEFERLVRDASVVALDSSPALAMPLSPLRFRVESSRFADVSALAIPLEYRVTAGAGDEFSVWSFPSLLRVDSAR